MHSLRPYRLSQYVSHFVEEYFQLVSLYSLVEYLQFGTMEFQIEAQISIARQAQWAIGNRSYDHEGNSLSMLIPIALLPTSVSGDYEGKFIPLI
jgi:hypothetical protein